MALVAASAASLAASEARPRRLQAVGRCPGTPPLSRWPCLVFENGGGGVFRRESRCRPFLRAGLRPSTTRGWPSRAVLEHAAFFAKGRGAPSGRGVVDARVHGASAPVPPEQSPASGAGGIDRMSRGRRRRGRRTPSSTEAKNQARALLHGSRGPPPAAWSRSRSALVVRLAVQDLGVGSRSGQQRIEQRLLARGRRREDQWRARGPPPACSARSTGRMRSWPAETAPSPLEKERGWPSGGDSARVSDAPLPPDQPIPGRGRTPAAQ